MLKFFNLPKNIITISVIIIFSLNSCNIYKYSDARKNPTSGSERVKKNIEEGKGFRLGSLGRKSTTFEFATSNALWRASIEKLNFAPLSNVDYAGGIIVTDWFNEGDKNEQIKITIRFLTNEIRSDAIDVIIHKKTCDQNNNCKINKIEGILNSEIRIAILKKAAQLNNKDLKSDQEKRGTYKIPGNNENNKKND